MNLRAILYDLQRLQCEAFDKGFESFNVAIYPDAVSAHFRPSNNVNSIDAFFSSFCDDPEGQLRKIEAAVNGAPTIDKTEPAEQDRQSSQRLDF